jgi:hypothetical protein
MKTQNESEPDSQSEFEPKHLTPLQNVILTAKVLGAVALLILVVWLLQRTKG